MKQYLVLMSMIILGIYIFNIIAGSEDSLGASLKYVWEQGVETRTYTP